VPSIAVVRDRLQNEYNEAFERLEDQLFKDIGDNPSREASCDERRFVAKYFQDAQGRPDRSKTQDALCFTSCSSWGDHHKCLKEAVEVVPGLVIHLTQYKAIVGWEGTIQRGIENEFSRLEDHHKAQKTLWTLSPQARYQSEQANLDLDLFLRKTLCIDKNGKTLTEGKRPSAPVLLDKWDLHDKNLPDKITSKAPGLLVERYESITVIGWDADNLKAEVERLKKASKDMAEQEKLENEQTRARKEAEKKARWDRRCKPYHDLVARQQQPPNPWEVQNLVGSYIVRWHGEEPKHYGDLNDPYMDADVMRINVFPCESSYGVKASFWFGMFEGIMLLAKSRRKLELLRKTQPKGLLSDGEDSKSDTSDEDSEDNGTDDEHDKPRLIKTGFGTFYGSRKAIFGDKKMESKSATTLADRVNVKKEPVTGQKRTIGDISDPWGVKAARLKRQLMGSTSMLAKPEQHEKPKEESVPNRIYFQFVANQVDGYPDVDDKNENLGHLDFDETRLAAKGQFVWPRFWGKDEPQLISIFKVAEKPNHEHQPDEWYMYDGRRWGGW